MRESETAKPIVIETLKFLYDLDMDDKKEVRYHEYDSIKIYLISRISIPHKIICILKSTG